MNGEQQEAVRRRRTRAEARQLVAEFVNSGMRRSEVALSAALPKGERLAKACNYTLTLWDKHTRFVEYPELELSNNLAENSMPPVALGRKNWIHVGSAQAGPKIAAILSVVESCRRLKLPVRDYLARCSLDSPISPSNATRTDSLRPGRLAFIDSNDRVVGVKAMLRQRPA